MATFKHMRASWGADIPISAEQFIDGVADWVGSVEHLYENPFKFTKCVYADGSSQGKIPCSRLMYPDKTGLPKEQADAIPEYFRETLLLVDREAQAIFYRVEGEPLGMRNYFANMEAEPLGPDECRATISARFDLLTSVPSEPFVDTLHKIYRAVILGVAGSRST
jgi:hypothetical protein